MLPPPQMLLTVVSMPRYTMRRTWPDDADRADDFVVRVGGKDAGRCYFMRAAGHRDVWRWTVYGISSGGMEDTRPPHPRISGISMTAQHPCGFAPGTGTLIACTMSQAQRLSLSPVERSRYPDSKRARDLKT
jgi:hypothetical protein